MFRYFEILYKFSIILDMKHIIFCIMTRLRFILCNRGSIPSSIKEKIYSLPCHFQTGSEAAQPPIQWLPGALSLGVKLRY